MSLESQAYSITEDLLPNDYSAERYPPDPQWVEGRAIVQSARRRKLFGVLSELERRIIGGRFPIDSRNPRKGFAKLGEELGAGMPFIIETYETAITKLQRA